MLAFLAPQCLMQLDRALNTAPAPPRVPPTAITPPERYVEQAVDLGREVARGYDINMAMLRLVGLGRSMARHCRLDEGEALRSLAAPFLDAAEAPAAGPRWQPYDPTRRWWSQASMRDYLLGFVNDPNAGEWVDVVLREPCPEGFIPGLSWALGLLVTLGLDKDEAWDTLLLAQRTHHGDLPEQLARSRLEKRFEADCRTWSIRERAARQELRRILPPLLMARETSAIIMAKAKQAALGPLLPAEIEDIVKREIYFAIKAIKRARA